MMRNQPRLVSALGVGLICACATALVYSPAFFNDPSQGPGVALFIWLAAVLGAAPLTAFLMNRRRPTATDRPRRLLTGLPQLPLLVLLTQVNLWVDVRSGYLPPGTSEHAMAYGFGTILSAFGGLLLWVLVGSAAGRGASRSAVSEHGDPEPSTTGNG